MEVSNLVQEALRDFAAFKNETGFIFPDLRSQFAGVAEIAAFAGILDFRFANVVNQVLKGGNGHHRYSVLVHR